MNIDYGRRKLDAVHNYSFIGKRVLVLLFLLMPIPAFLISMTIGTFPITTGEIAGVIVSRIGMDMGHPSVYETVIFQVRLPRVLLAMMVGSALSASGAAFQGIFRNPLVDPYILGLSSGAAFGAALSLGVVSWIPVQLSAFIFSLLAVAVACSMARTEGRTPVVSLVLSGVIVSAVFSSLLAIVQIAVDERALQSIVYWMMGSMNAASWSKLESSFPLALLGCLGILSLRWRLNVLALGDEEARSVGMDPERYKGIFVISAALASSSAVAVAGIIGLLGLIVPHILRMIFGPDHRILIPLCITFGATFMVLVDDLARAALGFEVPVGIITTLMGAPFFAYLLRRTRAGGWE